MTFENKVYYQYEVYASKEADFTPNTFNLIHQGQTSTFMYQAKPNETWYFKVCAINTHGNRTPFGSTYANTVKVDDLSDYSAIDLVQITHNQSPWKDAYMRKKGSIIEKSAIRSYFNV